MKKIIMIVSVFILALGAAFGVTWYADVADGDPLTSTYMNNVVNNIKTLTDYISTNVDGNVAIANSVSIGYSDSAVEGTLRFNPTTHDFEGYNGTEWLSLTQGGAVYGP